MNMYGPYAKVGIAISKKKEALTTVVELQSLSMDPTVSKRTTIFVLISKQIDLA